MSPLGFGIWPPGWHYTSSSWGISIYETTSHFNCADPFCNPLLCVGVILPLILAGNLNWWKSVGSTERISCGGCAQSHSTFLSFVQDPRCAVQLHVVPEEPHLEDRKQIYKLQALGWGEGNSPWWIPHLIGESHDPQGHLLNLFAVPGGLTP